MMILTTISARTIRYKSRVRKVGIGFRTAGLRKRNSQAGCGQLHPVCFSVKGALVLKKGQVFEGIIERVDFPNKGIVSLPGEEKR